jgi:hypothetical protein
MLRWLDWRRQSNHLNILVVVLQWYVKEISAYYCSDKPFQLKINDNEKSGLCTERDKKALSCDRIVISGLYPSL